MRGGRWPLVEMHACERMPKDIGDELAKITYTVSWLKYTAYEPNSMLDEDFVSNYTVDSDAVEEALKTTFSVGKEMMIKRGLEPGLFVSSIAL